MVKFLKEPYTVMINPNAPFYVLLPLEETYEQMEQQVVDASEYDFPFTIKAFADFVEDVVSTVLPSVIVNGFNSAVQKAQIFVGPSDAIDLVNSLRQDISIQARHLQLPIYPVGGFVYRFYITGDLNLHIHYESYSPQVNLQQTHTRDDILASIENGDYISEKLRRAYGI